MIRRDINHFGYHLYFCLLHDAGAQVVKVVYWDWTAVRYQNIVVGISNLQTIRYPPMQVVFSVLDCQEASMN